MSLRHVLAALAQHAAVTLLTLDIALRAWPRQLPRLITATRRFRGSAV
jgi:hypothetical protein